MAKILIGNVKGPKGDKGDTGATGATGRAGTDGTAATISVGTVSTVPYGTQPAVTNSGTEHAAVFNFAIPEGAPGESTTDASNLTVDTFTSSSASFPIPAAGEAIRVIMGKLTKWMSDIWSAVNGKVNTSDVTTSLAVTESGKVLDARAGKALRDNQNLIWKQYTYNYTVAADATLTITANDFGMANPSGYAVLCARSFSSAHPNVITRTLSPQNLANGTVVIAKNVGSATASTVYTLQIIYIKESLIGRLE